MYIHFQPSVNKYECFCRSGDAEPQLIEGPSDKRFFAAKYVCSEICAENEHVSNGACTACPAGKVNTAGDDPSGADTACYTCPAVDHTDGGV